MKPQSEFDQYRDSYHEQIEANFVISLSGRSVDYYAMVKGEYLVEALAERFPPGDRLKIIDIGCGHGNIHPSILRGRPNIEMTGVDMADSVVDVARKLHPEVTYLSYDGVTLPFPDGSFDVAFTVSVMHHVPPAQWQAFLGEMRRVVRPGGLIAVFEHNPFNPFTQMLVNTCPIDKNAKLLRAGRLKALMRGAKLDPFESRYILFTPFEGAFFRALDRMFGWLPLGAQYATLANRTP